MTKDKALSYHIISLLIMIGLYSWPVIILFDFLQCFMCYFLGKWLELRRWQMVNGNIIVKKGEKNKWIKNETFFVSRVFVNFVLLLFCFCFLILHLSKISKKLGPNMQKVLLIQHSIEFDWFSMKFWCYVRIDKRQINRFFKKYRWIV